MLEGIEKVAYLYRVILEKVEICTYSFRLIRPNIVNEHLIPQVFALWLSKYELRQLPVARWKFETQFNLSQVFVW